MKRRFMKRLALLLLLLLLFVLPGSPLAAQAWDPFPALPAGEHLAVRPDLDGAAYDSLRNCLRGLDSAAGAGYFAAIVGVTSADGSRSPERSDAVPYADALYRAWQPGARLDPATHLLIALGLDNRAVAVHPGHRWADLGFEGAAIGQTIDGSSFATYARGGDYGLALCDLALAIDRRLAALAGAAASPVAPAEARPVPAPAATESGGGLLGGCAVLVLLPLAALAVLAWVRHSRRRRLEIKVGDELARWKEKIEVAAERVLAIETEHPLYFATTAERWTGESRALDEEAADAVNRVFLLYSKAFELHGQAEALAAGAPGGILGLLASNRPLEEAWKLLRETEVRIETGEAEERRRIFLPLRGEYRGTSARLLDDLGAAYRNAYDRLRQVMEVAERARGLAESAGRAAAEALAAASRRGELGLPVEYLQRELDPWLERRRAADELVATDPVAAGAQLEEAAGELRRLAERAAAGNAAIEAVRGPIQALGRELRAEVERLRRAGFELREPGFDPDLRLDHGVAEARRIEDLLAAGEEQEATRLRAALEQGLEELQQQLAASEAARAGVPETLQRLEAACRQLASRVPEAEATLRGLAAEHAAEAFRDEADNLQELATLLGRLAEWFEHIREDHREQRYLSALADLERAEGLLAEGRELIDAVSAIEQQLNQARDDAKELAYRSQQLLGRLDELAVEGAPGIGAELRRSIDDLVARTTASLEEAGGPRPQWLELEAALGAAAEELQLTVAQVEQELEAHRAAEKTARELERRLRDLERRVTGEHRDREHVARGVDEVARQLAAWSARLGEPDFSGSELERQGKELAAAFDQARGSFEAEMDLVRQAEARRRGAETLLRQVDGRSFGYGVVADCRAGRRVLRQVDDAWRRRDWEAALSLAEEARQAIESEQQRCRDRARMLELEAQRRLAAQREAERRAQARCVGRGGPQSGGFGGPSVVLGPAFGGGARGGTVGSSRTSFGSRLGRRISAGSSFGGSRSGGSSW